jgi:hypothetical protein
MKRPWGTGSYFKKPKSRFFGWRTIATVGCFANPLTPPMSVPLSDFCNENWGKLQALTSLRRRRLESRWRI